MNHKNHKNPAACQCAVRQQTGCEAKALCREFRTSLASRFLTAIPCHGWQRKPQAQWIVRLRRLRPHSKNTGDALEVLNSQTQLRLRTRFAV